MPNGKIVWLEKGTTDAEAIALGRKNGAGLKHIIEKHGAELGQKGIMEKDIPNYIATAIKEGKVIGYQGKGNGRPIYEFKYNGKIERAAITIGNNGFIIGLNRRSLRWIKS